MPKVVTYSVASSRICTHDLLIASPNALPVAPPRHPDDIKSGELTDSPDTLPVAQPTVSCVHARIQMQTVLTLNTGPGYLSVQFVASDFNI